MASKLLKKERVTRDDELPVKESQIIHIEKDSPITLEIWYVEKESEVLQ